MRFTGHLDLARAWGRWLRRAKLPVAYSKGFNPQPRMNLAAALPLGFSSECELMDVWLEESLPMDELLARLLPAAPPGLTIRAVKEVELKGPSLQSRLTAMEYHVRLDPRPDLAERVAALLAAGALPRERRGKSYDLRPLVQDVWLEAEGLGMRLAARPGGTGRPDQVLLELGLDPLALHIHRTQLDFAPD